MPINAPKRQQMFFAFTRNPPVSAFLWEARPRPSLPSWLETATPFSSQTSAADDNEQSEDRRDDSLRQTLFVSLLPDAITTLEHEYEQVRLYWVTQVSLEQPKAGCRLDQSMSALLPGSDARLAPLRADHRPAR